MHMYILGDFKKVFLYVFFISNISGSETIKTDFSENPALEMGTFWIQNCLVLFFTSQKLLEVNQPMFSVFGGRILFVNGQSQEGIYSKWTYFFLWF